MILTTDQLSTFNTAAKPLIDWLSENCQPHTKVIVDGMSAELVEGIATVLPNERS